MSLPGDLSSGAALLARPCALGRDSPTPCRSRLWPFRALSLLQAPTCSPAVPDPFQVCDVHYMFELQYLTVVFACVVQSDL